MKFIDKWTPKDIIGLVVIFTGLILMSFGIDHTVSAVVIAITSYYFGRRIDTISKQ